MLLVIKFFNKACWSSTCFIGDGILAIFLDNYGSIPDAYLWQLRLLCFLIRLK